ncbi:hypothetical protein J1786_06985 [Rahnella sp. L72c]|uniref:Uncharacterized protein n=1 Tax=Rahnella perminowiae TaxID=2816244 RepID=A0ABS6KY89_9GAMM|nr:hypothetical protein [Rahnella perminowiae]MBU9834561.1 hypothetical protein [Rahnella perminowiae]
MNINTSTSTYKKLQNNSDVTVKSTNLQPSQTNLVKDTSLSSSGQSTISGQGLMMSRLFGNADANPTIQTTLTKDTMAMQSVNFLTKDDRNMLSGLYAQAQQEGTNLSYVDDLANDMGNYRMFSGVEANANDGTYDNSGHKRTFSFSADDTVTATRILNSGNMSSSVLDPGFVKYELDPGYSFSHRTNFAYLESVVNNTGSNATSAEQSQTSRFSTYVNQGQNNFVVNTASEVTLHTEEPDVVNVDGVFSVTETGMKHGFQLVGGKVVQKNDVSMPDTQSQSVPTLLDNFTSNEKIEKSGHDRPATLFDYHFSKNEDKKIQKY